MRKIIAAEMCKVIMVTEDSIFVRTHSTKDIKLHEVPKEYFKESIKEGQEVEVIVFYEDGQIEKIEPEE